MQKDDFKIFITDLCNYVGHKIPPPETLRLWFDDCYRIPAEALAWIKNRFKELESFPKSLPNWLFGQFHQWLDAHPEKKAADLKKGCDQCHEGFILASKFDDRVKYRGDVLFRCGNCNGGPGAIPPRARMELMAAGYCKPVASIVRKCHAPFPDPPTGEDGLKVWQPPEGTVDYPVEGELPPAMVAGDMLF